MAAGIFLIAAGILIALHPPLLAIIVASLLIFTGLTLTLISYRFKKMHKHFSNPYVNFFSRF